MENNMSDNLENESSVLEVVVEDGTTPAGPPRNVRQLDAKHVPHVNKERYYSPFAGDLPAKPPEKLAL
jgi:hypothetical protein